MLARDAIVLLANRAMALLGGLREGLADRGGEWHDFQDDAFCEPPLQRPRQPLRQQRRWTRLHLDHHREWPADGSLSGHAPEFRRGLSGSQGQARNLIGRLAAGSLRPPPPRMDRASRSLRRCGLGLTGCDARDPQSLMPRSHSRARAGRRTLGAALVDLGREALLLSREPDIGR